MNDPVALTAVSLEAAVMLNAERALKKFNVTGFRFEPPTTRRYVIRNLGAAWSVDFQVRFPTDHPQRGQWLRFGFVFWETPKGEIKEWRTELDGKTMSSDEGLDAVFDFLPPIWQWPEY